MTEEELREEIAHKKLSSDYGLSLDAVRLCLEQDKIREEHIKSAFEFADQIIKLVHQYINPNIDSILKKELPENPFIGDVDFHDRTCDLRARQNMCDGYALAQQNDFNHFKSCLEELKE